MFYCEFCSTSTCLLVIHRRDILTFLDNLIVYHIDNLDQLDQLDHLDNQTNLTNRLSRQTKPFWQP